MKLTDQSALTNYLATNWTATPIEWPNTEPLTVLPYIRLDILDSGVDRLTLGQTFKTRELGVIVISVFTDRYTGAGQAQGYADSLLALLSAKVVGNINIEPGFVRNVDTTENFYRLDVSFDYYILSQI